jgi:hypothetical protein
MAVVDRCRQSVAVAPWNRPIPTGCRSSRRAKGISTGEVVTLGAHWLGHAEGGLGHDPRASAAVPIGGLEHQGNREYDVSLLGDHLDQPRPVR